MPTRKWILLSSCGFLAAMIVLVLLHRTQVATARPMDDGSGLATADPLAHLTRLQLDVFELVCPHEQLANFELDQIKAGNPSTAEVLQRLGKLGSTRLLIRYDNVVDLSENTTIGTGQRVPAVRDVTISSNGNIIPSVDYKPVGFMGSILGAWTDGVDPMQARVSFHLECGDLTERNVRVAQDVNVPIFSQRLRIEQTRMLISQDPIWLACNDLRLSSEDNAGTNMTLIRMTATRMTD